MRDPIELRYRFGKLAEGIKETDCSASFADSVPISMSCFREKKLMLWPVARSSSTPNAVFIMASIVATDSTDCADYRRNPRNPRQRCCPLRLSRQSPHAKTRAQAHESNQRDQRQFAGCSG